MAMKHKQSIEEVKDDAEALTLQRLEAERQRQAKLAPAPVEEGIDDEARQANKDQHKK
jgi:hypothetical protein